jgi:hypothetical protein
MGLGLLLRRRLLTHPVALAAVVVAVPVSMTSVATVQLLSAAISDASVRSTLDVPEAARSVGSRPARWGQAGVSDVACWGLSRTMPSWATVARSRPSRANIRPRPSPRPEVADGDSSV